MTRRALRVGLPAEVALFEGKRRVAGGDALRRLTVHGDESGAQRLVPSHEAIQRPPQGAAIEVAA